MTLSQMSGAFLSLTRTRVFATGLWEQSPWIGQIYCPIGNMSMRQRMNVFPKVLRSLTPKRSQILALTATVNEALGEIVRGDFQGTRSNKAGALVTPPDSLGTKV